MIDRGLANRWPDEVTRAVARFKQGDLVARPPFFYAGVPLYGIWDLTRSVGSPDAGTEVFELDPDAGEPPYGLITTQTCDLDEQARQPRQPWIQLSPVYRWDDLTDDRRRQVERHEVGHLVKLTAAQLSSGFWVADLRIEFPVEKGWLVNREPMSAFADEDDRVRFADHLARRRARPALADPIIEGIVSPLRKAVGKLSKRQKSALLDPIEEIRLSVGGDRLAPSSARILILAKTDPPSPPVVAWFDQWWTTVQKPTEALGLALLGTRYTTLDNLSEREYVDSISLDFRYLSPEE